MLSRFGKTEVFVFLLCVVAICVFSNSSLDFSVFSHRLLNLSRCACHKCMAEGDPFTARIQASPQPFLSRQYPTSEDAFNWWKRLQSEGRNFTFYNATVDNLFQTFPLSPGLEESSPDRCRTCAVVGNSGNLKRSHYGPLIDCHDFVIRMNHGLTKGYEADVGTKTTHHVMYPESALHLDNATHLVLFAFKINDLLWLLRELSSGSVNSNRIANKDLVMILHPAFMQYVHEVWLENKGKYPSTGFMTLLLSMHICDKINVFGFGADGDGNWSHYFEILRNKRLRTGPHAGMQEYKMIQQLHEKEKITLFKGF